MCDGSLVLLALASADACLRLPSALREQGYRVIAAQSGREAVRSLCTVVPAAIIAEWELADLPGREMQTILRTMCPTAARLVLTSQPSLESSIAALEEGALAYLPTNVEAATLLGKLRPALERRSEALGEAALQSGARHSAVEMSLYRGALEYTPDLLMAVDTGDRFVFANHAFLAFHGLSPEQVLGRDTDEVFTDARVPEGTRPPFSRCLQGSILDYDVNWIHASLGARDIRVACRPVRDCKGAIIGAVASARDITEESMTEIRCQHLRRELDGALADKEGHSSASAAHKERAQVRGDDAPLRVRLVGAPGQVTTSALPGFGAPTAET